ncbi:MAG: NAD(P)H-dependent glycerol-3-phosphate dehydrogenase [Pseudomonadota bacterium]
MSDTMNSYSPIAVLGAGAWGTALALHLARKGQTVTLWAYEKEQVDQINTMHANSRYLPEQLLPASIVCSHEYQEVLAGVQDILIVVPSTVFRVTLLAIKPFLLSNQRLLWATKGLDEDKHQLLHEVASDIVGDIDKAVLSGPSFAKEVAIGLPTAVTIASNKWEFANDLSRRFQSKNFRVELTTDMVGVELGGAIKNVLAIAVGIVEGLGFGANAKAAFITQGLSEMIALGLSLGAKQSTFLGLSGLGDFILTSTDNQSRNRRLGLALGQGQTLKQAKKELGTTEGVVTANNIFYLLEKYKINAPICEAVYRILYEQQAPNILFDAYFK